MAATRDLKTGCLQVYIFIWLWTRQQLTKLSQADKTLHLPDGALSAQSTVRNLGVQLYSEPDAQAWICVKTCYYHLRRTNEIKRYVDQDCLRSLVHAFITSQLDYCNSLYAQLDNDCDVIKSCRSPCSQRPATHIAQHLHWLLIEARISYKLCSHTELRIISSNSVNLAQTRVYVLRHAATIMSPVLTGVLIIVPFLSLPPLFGIVWLAISVAHLLSLLS